LTRIFGMQMLERGNAIAGCAGSPSSTLRRPGAKIFARRPRKLPGAFRPRQLFQRHAQQSRQALGSAVRKRRRGIRKAMVPFRSFWKDSNPSERQVLISRRSQIFT